MKITRIFLCDNVSVAQFGKLNVVGMLPTAHVAVSPLPYAFISNLVVCGEIDSADVTDLKIRVDFISNDITIGNSEHALGGPAKVRQTGNPPFTLFLVLPVIWEIKGPCTAHLSFVHNGTTIYEEDLTFTEGEAPNTKRSEHIKASGIFSGKEDKDIEFVQKLLGTASIRLKIFDQYVSADVLEQLLAHVDPKVAITIVASTRVKGSYKEKMRDLLKRYPNLTVTFSSREIAASHDRFAILNDSEFFHFGHSLADICTGKLSRYSKVIDADEIEELLVFLAEIEASATT